jgi:hypothetical protein
LNDPNLYITDDYWQNILLNTRPKQEGPNAIQLWNIVRKDIKNASHA